jgi:hypothetical protein
MSIPHWPPKDPDSVLDYFFDWSTWLSDNSDTLDTYSVTIAEGGAALVVDDDSEADGVITVWLSGGTVDTRYLVRSRVTTTGGRTEDMSRYLRIVEK